MRRAPLLILCVASLARAGTLWVDWPGGGVPCAFDEVTSALRARLPGQEVELGRHPVGLGHAQVVFSRQGDEWLLEVRALDVPPLRRILPGGYGDCLAFAQRSSLVVDRYLADIRWTGSAVELGRVAPPEPQPLPVRTRGVVEVGAGGGAGEVEAVGLAPAGAAAAQLDIGLVHGAWLFELGALAELPFQIQIPSTGLPNGESGSLTAQAGLLRLSLGRMFAAGAGTFRVELVPGAAFVKAFGSGTGVFNKQAVYSEDPFIGARVGYQWPLGTRFFVAARLEARVLLLNDSFLVPGYNVLSARTSPVSGEVTLGLGYFFF